jgi:hypothetical protein
MALLPAPNLAWSAFLNVIGEKKLPTPDAAADSPTQYAHASASSVRYTKLVTLFASVRINLFQMDWLWEIGGMGEDNASPAKLNRFASSHPSDDNRPT